MPNKPRDPWALKYGFTNKEWAVFQGRLTHARKAIEMLMERAPELFEQLHGHAALNPRTHELTNEYQDWINTVVKDLFHVQQRRPLKTAKATLKKPVLALVKKTQ
jgi:hypothetical protein